MAEIVLWYYGDWAAAYEDGDLVFSGSDVTVKENLLEHLGVKWEHGRDFMLGGNGLKVASSLAEIREFREEQAERLRKAMALEEQAREMLDEAERLRNGS